MSKINIPTVSGGFNLSQINSNFDQIEQHLNDRVLYRDVPTGEPNQMVNDLDMNSYRIYNLPEPIQDHEPLRKVDADKILDIPKVFHFQPPVIYTEGLNITNGTFTVDYQGVIYYPRPSYIPFTTGVWNPSQWSPLQNTNPGNELLVFDDYASASTAAAMLPDGQEIEAPNSDARLSRFEVQSGALVFKDFAPDAIRLQSYAALRTYTGTAQAVDIINHNLSGRFSVDSADTSSTDNGGTLIVDQTGRRWKRSFSGTASWRWFCQEGMTTEQAIDAMGLALGYVGFQFGATPLSSVTIDYPMYFCAGAYIEVLAGQTVSLTNTVNSQDQWIFRGNGNVAIPLPDIDSGEDLRELKAIWFGAFTQMPTDQAPAIQRAVDALGNSREGVVHLDLGNYLISSGIELNRGVKLKGVGTRRTVLKVTNDGYPVVTTRHTACFVEDLQFENEPTLLTREFPYVHLKHDFCEVTNIFHQSSKNPIVVDGPNCKVRNIESVYGGTAPAAGSSQVLVRASGVSVADIYSRFSTGAWPEAIVRVGDESTGGSITGFTVRNVEYIGGSIGVLVHAQNKSIARGSINGVNSRGVSGVPEAVVKMVADGTGGIFQCPIENVICPNTATTAVKLVQNGTGSFRNISFDSIHDAGESGSSLTLIQTAGVMDNIYIGCNWVTQRPEIVAVSEATVGAVRAVRNAIPGRRYGKTVSFTLPRSGHESGGIYHFQSSTPITCTLGSGVTGDVGQEYIITTSGAAHVLAPGSGATLNGATSSVTLTAGTIYTLAMSRNVDGSSAQWFVK